MSIQNCHNVAHFRALAERKLPAAMFHYIDGGGDDEVTLRRNTTAFEKYRLLPRYLVDVGTIDTRTKVLGKTLEWPVFLAPTGMSRLFHHEKELGAARAAAKLGTLYTLSTLATTSLEDVAKATTGPKMFQVYIHKDRALTSDFVQRCKAAGYDALCLTVDMPVAGNRERDKVTGMTMPPKFGLKSLINFAMHPAWALNFLRYPDFRLANVVHRVDALGSGAMPLIEYVNSQFDRTVTWDDVAWLAKQWDGPFVIKGIQAVQDVKAAQASGATAVMVSNHGGRQLDGAPAPIDSIAPLRDALGDSIELIVDGGIRRGTHVIKALAMGANACSIGRGYLYSLAAGGEAGVTRCLTLLRAEVERDMALLGLRDIASINRECLSQD